ncbi:hypothetical protein FPRO06_06000 [Fusarium proliferatum]|uniref:Uncharacterized protein n=1 Tax=Gibberella intermedia TaxID=948311 RepID=A0A365MMY5_GIBIN|nr:hypothetical protein FPRO03_09772 [Fusarium proliferatum]KAG4288348.1 hypothetical protein FPRO06_06000 [Fusarium proliferatum]RBA09886.1 hypothetical protein FPRO05_05822 [Fusarium proliferatum]
MFDTDFLRFDLEHPEQVILIPTKYNSQILMERDAEGVVAKMKESSAIPNQTKAYLNPKPRKVVSTAEGPNN